MPELPEVETVRRLLATLVQGKMISHIDIYRNKNILGDCELFVSSLKGATIREIRRKGKWLAFILPPFAILSHLRMEGKYFYEPTPEPQGKHDILRFYFTDGSALLYQDVRKFGRLELIPYETLSVRFAALGDEPFDLSAEELRKRLANKRIPIKQAIMDQSIVSGIGNIYADETLFACGISPFLPANEVTKEQCQKILRASCRILATSIEEGGSTIRSYHPGKGIDGAMQLHLRAYGKAGSPCPRCGAKFRKATINGRGTTYCPICQKNPQKPFVLGITGPIHVGKSTVSRFFFERGYALFDADKIAHEAYQNSSCKKKIVALFGPKSYVEDQPNFVWIRSVLTKEPALKSKLEGIIHPYVIAQAKRAIVKAKGPIVLDVPLLFPSHMDELCDATILVTSSPNKQRKRLEEEGKDAEALLTINAKYPLEEAKKKADFVVVNDAGLEDLRQELERLPLA